MSTCLTSLLFFSSSTSLAGDTVRLSLEAKSGLWFHCLVWSSIVVGIGVLFEGPEATIALKRWYRNWRGKEVSPENPNSWVIPASYLGFVLVVGGVIGEGIFEFLSSNVETALRSHDEQVLGNTISSAGDAKDSADAAALAAKNANDQSGQATTASLNARAMATAARREADSFEQDIANAKRQAADAESHLASALERAANAEERTAKAEAEIIRLESPRSLTRLEDLVSALRQYKGTEYVLNTFADQESMHLTVEIGKALKQAGWVRKQPPGMNIGVPTMSMIFEGTVKEMVPSCVDTGVSINVHTKESLAELNSKPLQSGPMTVQAGMALRNALPATIVPQADGNVAVGIIDPTPGEGPITICVGKKPL